MNDNKVHNEVTNLLSKQYDQLLKMDVVIKAINVSHQPQASHYDTTRRLNNVTLQLPMTQQLIGYDGNSWVLLHFDSVRGCFTSLGIHK